MTSQLYASVEYAPINQFPGAFAIGIPYEWLDKSIPFIASVIASDSSSFQSKVLAVAWYAIPLALGCTPAAITVPVTCIAWKLFVFVTVCPSPKVVLPLYSWCVALIGPPSQIRGTIPVPVRFNPKPPPERRKFTRVDVAAFALSSA